jgi:phosphohistidine phosphatase
MKTVMLMRHADSYHTDFSGYEHERSVSVTGLLQIERIRATNLKLLKDVDFVLCSGVKRAKQTFQAIYSAIPENTRFLFDDTLYQITTSELLEKIQWTPSIYNKILVIGHNPGLSQFIENVLPNEKVEKLGTCEIAVFEAEVKSWQEVDYNRLVLVNRITPDINDHPFTGE